jgi:hypothetical protein
MVGEGLAAVAAATDPLTYLRVPKMPNSARKLMTEALNPSEKVLGKMPDIADQALKRGLQVSKGGAEVGQKYIDDIIEHMDARNKDVADLAPQIGMTGATGEDILSNPKVGKVFKKANTQFTPTKDDSAAMRAAEDFWTKKGSEEYTATRQVPKPLMGSNGKPLLDAKGNPIMTLQNEDFAARRPKEMGYKDLREHISGTNERKKLAHDAGNDAVMEDKMIKAISSSALDEMISAEEEMHKMGLIDEPMLRNLGNESADRIRIQEVIERAIRDEAKSSSGILRIISGSAGTAAIAAALSHPKVAVAALGVGGLRGILARKDVKSAIATALYNGGTILPKGTTPISRTALAANALIPEPPKKSGPAR